MFLRKKNPCGMSNRLLDKMITEFPLGRSTNIITKRIRITGHKLLKTMTLLRAAMTKDVPNVFQGTVEVDETYLGGQWKNKRLEIRRGSVILKKGRGTTRQPVLGILCRNGRVWAELIDKTEAENL